MVCIHADVEKCKESFCRYLNAVTPRCFKPCDVMMWIVYMRTNQMNELNCDLYKLLGANNAQTSAYTVSL